MVGGTDYDFGAGANADTWRQTVDLANMTTVGTDYRVIKANSATAYIESAAGDVFGIKVITGSTAACTCTIDVFGYLV